LTRGQAFFLQHNGDAVLSHQMALGVLDQSRAQQASSLAYFDVFSFSAERIVNEVCGRRAQGAASALDSLGEHRELLSIKSRRLNAPSVRRDRGWSNPIVAGFL
jgi:hypothetical protein